MKRYRLFALILPSLLLLASVLCRSTNSFAQASEAGAVSFVAHVQPTDGTPEPAREFAFFLLRKSFADIRAEAAQAQGAADMDSFIDALNVSAPLKSWMKKHHRVDLAGTDFTKLLTADDVVDIPEFLAAYNDQNGSAVSNILPEPRPKGNKPADQEKYQHQMDQYHLSLKRYIDANLDSVAGLDAALADVNPSRRWTQLQNEQNARATSQALRLAQTQYLAAKAVTDLDGRGSFSGIAPGDYWISSLDTPAMAGDLRLRWDVRVTVKPGQTSYLELSNLNAMDPAASTTP